MQSAWLFFMFFATWNISSAQPQIPAGSYRIWSKPPWVHIRCFSAARRRVVPLRPGLTATVASRNHFDPHGLRPMAIVQVEMFRVVSTAGVCKATICIAKSGAVGKTGSVESDGGACWARIPARLFPHSSLCIDKCENNAKSPWDFQNKTRDSRKE